MRFLKYQHLASKGPGQEISSEDTNPAILLKKKRAQSSQRVTLAIKHLLEIIDKGQGEDNQRRLKREIEHLHEDYETVRDQNRELYDFVDDKEEHEVLDQWENDLSNDEVEIYWMSIK